VGQEETPLVLAILKDVMLPVMGFILGFCAKWFLQNRKSRDELVEALACPRADALRELWAITTLRPRITSLQESSPVPTELLAETNCQIMRWYTEKGGALFLSWHGTRTLFSLLDSLRDEKVTRRTLEERVSALRTRLKRDCGIYSYFDARRMLVSPRPSPWPYQQRKEPISGWRAAATEADEQEGRNVNATIGAHQAEKGEPITS
jgi:hypothetical protein